MIQSVEIMLVDGVVHVRVQDEQSVVSRMVTIELLEQRMDHATWLPLYRAPGGAP